MKKIIICADDFGYSKVFNEVILDLLEKDLISCVSVMVDYISDSQKQQIERLIELEKNRKGVVGLHIDFKSDDFKKEIERQYEKFVSIFGFEPTNLDLHKSTYLEDGYPVIMKYCAEKGIPCRNNGVLGAKVISTKEKAFDGTNLEFDEVENWLGSLDEEISAIFFHPGKYDPESKSSLNKEREVDTENIVELNDEMRRKGIKLVSCRDLK